MDLKGMVKSVTDTWGLQKSSGRTEKDVDFTGK